MTDRKLLELAAKAAGYTLENNTDANGLYWPWCVELGDNWCPLTNDGDAFRLAVRLEIDLQFSCSATWVELAPGHLHHEAHRDDPYAATRRAIVRAAAALGEEL